MQATVISTAFRTRLKDPNRQCAIIEDDAAAYANQDALSADWIDRIKDIDSAEFVDGAGEHGVFSTGMVMQAAQFSDDVKFYGICLGLGVVEYAGKSPQYDLGKHETAMKGLLAEGERFSAKIWWNAITNAFDTSIAGAILTGVEQETRVIVAIPAAVYPMIREDIEALIPADGEYDGKDEEVALFEEVVKYLRFTGPDLEEAVHPDFLDCVMPWDAEQLADVVPGARTNAARRMAFLLTKVCDEKVTDAATDYNTLDGVLAADDGTVFSYDVATPTTGEESRYTKLSDEEAVEMIHKSYYKRCHGSPIRIARIMRNNGYMVNKDRVEDLLSADTPVSKPKSAPSGGSSGGKAKAASGKKKASGGKTRRPARATATVAVASEV